MPLSDADTDTAPLARFARLAGDFCVLVERHAAMDREAFLHAVHLRLAPLYAAALALPPEVEPDDDEPEEEEEEGDDLPPLPPVVVERDPDRGDTEEGLALLRSLGRLIGEDDAYAEVFDPYGDPEEPTVTGSVADDLADIRGDLRPGLAKWERGEVEDALWEWRFNFQVHWGEHLTSVLRALHARAAFHDGGFPRPSGEG